MAAGGSGIDRGRRDIAANEADEGEETPLLGNQRSGGAATAAKTTAEDIDARFKRWLDYVARLAKRGKGDRVESIPSLLVSVFEKESEDARWSSSTPASLVKTASWDGYISDPAFDQQLAQVKKAISQGMHPKMIQTGSSGSYFARVIVEEHTQINPDDDRISKKGVDQDRSNINGAGFQITSAGTGSGDHKHARTARTVAVFKPNDEEPYGNLNPKRVLLRRYLWWAMGRPCLIPSFSYLSEVGASLLDDRLSLGIVPSTRLVSLASEAFSYPHTDRERGHFREKVGSYQHFLVGYINASTFFRAHPWPSRPRKLLEQDLEAENTAHGRAKTRKGRAKRRRQALKRKRSRRACLDPLFSCCFPRRSGQNSDDGTQQSEDENAEAENVEEEEEEEEEQGFFWTKELMQNFRLELEKLVCFDYLIRNTDRGLDNFMIKMVKDETGKTTSLSLAAIDNSLAFPWKHPAGIRSYPWGWLYLPTDLIGGSFTDETRSFFIPRLCDAAWWHTTTEQLRQLFEQDAHFDESKFRGQMDVLRGQGYNLLQSLRNDDEGPLELCARTKQLVKHDQKQLSRDQAEALTGAHLRLHPKPVIVVKQSREITAVSSAPARAVPSRTPSIEKNKPVQISQARNTDAKSSENNDNQLQPRSLPEPTSAMPEPQRRPSAIDNVSSPTRRKHGSETGENEGQQGSEEPRHVGDNEDGVERERRIGLAYRRARSGLGIDVLAEFDKRTGGSQSHGKRNASKSRLPIRPPLKPTLTALPSPSSASSSSSKKSDLTAARRLYGSSNEATMRSGGLLYDSKSTSSSSNYQSIQAVMEQANRPAQQAEEGEEEEDIADDDESRMNMSIASMPNDNSAKASMAAALHRDDGAALPTKRRTRGSSVGAWDSDEGGQQTGLGRMEEEMLKLVIVERLEADEGVAWQTYLGLQ